MQNTQMTAGYNASFASAGLAAGTNAGTFQIANTVPFVVDGVFGSRAALDNIAFSAGHAAVPPSSVCLFGVWVDASGNVTTTQGPIVPSDQVVAPLPPYRNSRAFVGLVKVTTNGSTTFTPGTTSLGAGGVTAAYFNCSVLPGAAK